MRKYSTENLGENCGICGLGDGPLKVARAMTDKILDKETFHYHPNGWEYYLFISGKATMKIGKNLIAAEKGDMIVIEPGEPHIIVEVKEKADYVVFNTNPDPKDKVVL